MRYRFKTRPYRHQYEALKTLLRNDFGGALLMEPRTGKTKTAIDWLCVLAMRGSINKAVVVCPARVIDVWVEQFHMHAPIAVRTVVWDAKARKEQPLPRPSSAYDLTVVIVNYDAFATPGRRLKSGRRSKANGRFKFRQLLLKWIGKKRDTAIVLDESHKIKSPSGKSANMVVSLGAHFDYRVILTGTPVTKAKRIHDLYMQWQFLNPARLTAIGLYTVADVKEFTGVWTKSNGYPQWLRGRESNIDILKQAIHTDSVVVRRKDCFDLPPLDRQIIPVTLSKKTAALYDRIATEMVAEIEHAKETHTVEASIKLVQGLRLSQITGGVATTDEGKLIRVGNEKLKALSELLEEIVEHDEKVVIAARFKPDLNAIVKLCRKMNMKTFELRGGVSRDEATSNIKQFKQLDSAGAFIMQPQSGALGIDLSTAFRIIWFSLPTSWVDFTQSNDRIALSKEPTTETYLLASGTIDEIQYAALQDDKSVSDMILKRPELLLRRT